MTERNTAMTRGATRNSAAGDTYERQLRSVLTSAQKATWDQMAGRGPGPTAPAPADATPVPAARHDGCHAAGRGSAGAPPCRKCSDAQPADRHAVRAATPEAPQPRVSR